MSPELVVFGAGGHATSVTNIALSCGYTIIAYIDDKRIGSSVFEVPIVSTKIGYRLYPDQNYCVAIGDNAVREQVVNSLRTAIPNAEFPSLVHPSSVIGVGSTVGDGTVIMPNSNIGPNSSVGSFCIVNSSSSIDHDCLVKDFASLAPGVITGGNVTVGVRSAVSIGSTIKHGISIGDDTVIGARSYVDKDMQSEVVAYGTPCRKIRSRKIGDTYLS